MRAQGFDLSGRRAFVLCAAAVLVGGGVRLATGFNDFWLDEVWTWNTVQQLRSPLDVFTAIHHSNNNHLNTLLVYWIGDARHWIVYRIPSLLAGTASIALAAAIALRRGRLEAALASVLVASCFALLHFSSEARGYALAVAFALSAHLALQRDLERPRAWSAALFAASVVLGVLAHLVYLFYYAGAVAQQLVRLRARYVPPARWPRALLRLHGVPLLALAVLGWLDLRFLTVGGGNPTDYAALAARTVGFGFGLPVLRGLALPYGAAFLALVGAGLGLRRRAGDDAWVAWAIAIVAAPALVISLLRPEVVAVRYFLIGLAFTLLLLADLLALGLRRGGVARGAAVAALALFLGGNAVHTAAFLEHGRGGFSEAVRTMAEQSGPTFRVGSDHDFRNRVVLEFYARRLPKGHTMVYLPRSRWPSTGVDWLVTHRAQRPATTPGQIVDSSGNRYTLVAEFDHAAISGFYWALYRNASAGAGSPGRSPRP